jgi:hypothetical protein
LLAVATPGIRSWFTRDVLESLERGSNAVVRLSERLPQRLQGYVDLAALRSAGPIDAILLDDAEELFLNIDSLLGDGSGRVLENVALELALRTLAQGAGVVVPGDLMGTVARMRAAVERPFVGVNVTYQLLSTDTGFTLIVGVPGRPRSARLLRHFALGAIRAAQRFSRGADDESLKILADTVGDRTTITAHYRSPKVASAPASPKNARRPSRSMRAAAPPNLSEEVERILARTATEPPPGVPTRKSQTDPPPSLQPRRTMPSTPPEASPAIPRMPSTGTGSSAPARRTTRPDPPQPEDDEDRPTPLTGEDPSRKR